MQRTKKSGRNCRNLWTERNGFIHHISASLELTRNCGDRTSTWSNHGLHWTSLQRLGLAPCTGQGVLSLLALLFPAASSTTKAHQNPGSHCLVLDFVEVMMHHPTMAQLRFLFCRRGWLQDFDLIAPQQTITKFITAPWEDKIPSHLWSKRLKSMLQR